MKKILSFTLSAALFLSACEVPTEEERIEQLLEDVEAEAQEENADFYEENQGGAPDEVLETRVLELLTKYDAEDYGKLDEDMGYNYSGEKIYGHADIAAQKTGLDYSKLAYIQYWSGTNGVSSLVKSMDSSATGVKEVQAMFDEYNAINAYDPDYFESVLPSGLSEDEKAAATLKIFADLYRVFSEPYDDDYISPDQETDMKQIQTDTGMDADDLSVVFKNGLPELVGEAFSDTWDYKTRFIELAKF